MKVGDVIIVAGTLATHAGLTTTAHGGLVPSARKITASIDLSADRTLGAADVGASALGHQHTPEVFAVASMSPVVRSMICRSSAREG